MPEATLLQILEARDKRAELQKRLISVYNTSLICFTMNIAGPVKTTPLIERAFFVGEKLLKEKLRELIIHSQSNVSVTGCQAMFCVNEEAQKVKEICQNIEENHPLGRLFDMDVIAPNGEKLSRKDLRGCIVCGKEGRECAAGRLHTVNELQTVTNKIITDYFVASDADYFGSLAYQSLLEELYTTPKAGLVDRNNNGSHKDMDVQLFEKSALALKPYFRSCFEIGYKTRELSCETAFSQLRQAGIEAEKIMYGATNGVNTHKGAIFSLGVLCGAVGRLWNIENRKLNSGDVFSMCAELVKNAMDTDFKEMDTSTAGGRLYRKFGLTGIRGEVAGGFCSVENFGLPIFLKALKEGFSRNDAGAITLAHLISKVEDTTIYNRGGKSGADFAKQSAKKLFENSSFPTIEELEWLDEEFINRNLSAGGCADLLAVTYFMEKL